MTPGAGIATLKRLMVPLDGSRLAECVIPVAVSLAVRLEARLTLLYVMERQAHATVHGDRHLTDASEADAYLTEVSARMLASGVVADRHVHPNQEGDVAKSIVDHAGDLAADLVILATHGGGGARRVLFGSVAQQVLRRGTRPVLLVRPPEPAQPVPASFEVRRLLVPLDGQPPAEAAMPYAVAVAAAYGAEVLLVRVVPTLATLGGDRVSAARLVPTAAAASLDLEEQEARRYSDDVVRDWAAGDRRLTASVLRGEPAQTLREIAAKAPVDLVIMATHGRSGLDAVFTGSTASRIAGRIPVPLLLVRAS